MLSDKEVMDKIRFVGTFLRVFNLKEVSYHLIHFKQKQKLNSGITYERAVIFLPMRYKIEDLNLNLENWDGKLLGYIEIIFKVINFRYGEIFVR